MFTPQNRVMRGERERCQGEKSSMLVRCASEERSRVCKVGELAATSRARPEIAGGNRRTEASSGVPNPGGVMKRESGIVISALPHLDERRTTEGVQDAPRASMRPWLVAPVSSLAEHVRSVPVHDVRSSESGE